MQGVHACKVASVVSNSATLWTVAHQTPLSMGLSRQDHWSGLPYPPPGYLPNPRIKPMSLLCLLHWQVGSLPLALPGNPTVQGTLCEIPPKTPKWQFLYPCFKQEEMNSGKPKVT